MEANKPDTPSCRTVILAGNMRLDIVGDQLVSQLQPAAFRAALLRAKEVEQDTGLLPPIAIAIDHKGIFRKQFVRDGVSNSRKRHPRLSDLKPEVLALFAPALVAADVNPEAVHVIHEDSARTSVTNDIAKGKIPDELIRRVSTPADATTCSIATDADGPRANCTGITWEYFRRTADLLPGGTAADVLEVFFENTIWSAPAVYIRGVLAFQQLGCPVSVRLNIVLPDGRVYAGKPARPTVHAATDVVTSTAVPRPTQPTPATQQQVWVQSAQPALYHKADAESEFGAGQ